METTTCIRSVSATRDFTDRPVDEATIRKLIDSARRAGSGHNRQPWTFVAVRDRERLDTLASFGEYTTPLTRAPLGIILIIDKHESSLKQDHNLFDAGRAAQNMILTATELELGIVPQAIQEKSDAAEFLGVPSRKRVLIGFAIGYPASDPDESIEGTDKAEELDSLGRKRIKEVLYWETISDQ